MRAFAENEPAATRSGWSVASDFLSLTKPRLSLLVMFTCAGGLWLSGARHLFSQWVVTLLATAGTVGAANAFNCYWERVSDRQMARTAVRPLPDGRMEPYVALLFAFSLALTSIPTLFLGVNPLTGALGLVALLSYVLVYTPLKSRTHWAMLAGAVPGALPPLMGWTAGTNRIDEVGLALFAILFFWQLPHFIAIALFRRDEYQAAGLKSLPLERGDDVARRHAVIYAGLLWAVSVLPFFLDVAGPFYLAAALGLGGWFFGLTLMGWKRSRGAAWARQLFGASLLYLTGLFIALGADGGWRA